MLMLDLRSVCSNKDNTRMSTPLQKLGYGVVERLSPDMPSLWELAFGNEHDQAKLCTLVEAHDEELELLAYSVATHGQLQPVCCRPVADGKYAITFGARRSLACLYNYCKHGTEPVVDAVVRECDDRTGMILSGHENLCRLKPSFLDEAVLIKRLKDSGLKVKDIVKQLPISKKAPEQTIRNRLLLLELAPEDQLRVHDGELSQDAAIKIVKEKRKQKAAPETPPAPPEIEETEDSQEDTNTEQEDTHTDHTPAEDTKPTPAEEEADKDGSPSLKSVLERLFVVQKLIDDTEALQHLNLAINELQVYLEL